jgi:hypothetical protein
VAVMVFAQFEGDVEHLKHVYDRAHLLIGEQGAPTAELRHHCAISDDALYLIGVWESEERLWTRFESREFRGDADVGGLSLAQNCRRHGPAAPRN